MSKRAYTISELAAEFDVTTRTIRFYEEKGLLSPRREGQTRSYSAADRVSLKLILRGKRLGLTLDESGDLIRMYKPGSNNRAQLERLIDRIQTRRADLAQQLEEIQITLSELTEAEHRAQLALEQLPTH